MDSFSTDADARHAALSNAVFSGLGILIGFFMNASPLMGDGGTVQFQKEAGPFIVTLFSAPTPLRVGVADLSVLVQRAEDRGEVLDCEVILTLSKPDRRVIRIEATRAQATNKLLYAASVAFDKPGKWNADLDISARGRSYPANGEINVLSTEPRVLTYWPYFAILPVAVGLFILNQRLKRNWRVRHPRAQP